MDIVDKLQAQALMRTELLSEQRDFLVEFTNQKTFDRALKKSKITMIDFLVWLDESRTFKAEFEKIQRMKALKTMFNIQSIYDNSIEILNETIVQMLDLTPELLEQYYNDELSVADKAKVERLLDEAPNAQELAKLMSNANTMALGFKKFVEMNLQPTQSSSTTTIESFLDS